MTSPGALATIATATAAATSFSVQSDVPWLAVNGGSTGAVNNMAFAVVANQLSQLPFGIATGTLTVTPANGALPLQIPVSIDVRLPEFHYVAPVAFTDQLDTDYVIVRGSGFTSPGFQMRIDGTLVASADIVSDTELRLVPGQLAVGDHPVTTGNALGITRDSARLRVADPPPYQNALVPADIGPQTRVVSSPINGAVFSARAYFIDSFESPAVGNSSVIQRFAFGAGTHQWTRTEYAYPQLFDFALSPDESLLIVLTSHRSAHGRSGVDADGRQLSLAVRFRRHRAAACRAQQWPGIHRRGASRVLVAHAQLGGFSRCRIGRRHDVEPGWQPGAVRSQQFTLWLHRRFHQRHREQRRESAVLLLRRHLTPWHRGLVE